MANSNKNTKGYYEKRPAQPQGSVNHDKNDDKSTFPSNTSPNETLSIPERKLKKDKK
jgi:hypothetical protein